MVVMDHLARFRRAIRPLLEEKVITTGCPVLDQMLRGGIRCGILTELTGCSSGQFPPCPRMTVP